MFRIIITVVFLIAIAVLIVLNIGATADVNVFGWKTEALSVPVVAIVSFVAGVVYSFIFYLLSYLERGRRERLEKKKKKLKSQAAELKSREQEADGLAEESRQQIERARRREAAPQGARPGLLSGLFGRGRTPAETVPEPEINPESTSGKRKK